MIRTFSKPEPRIPNPEPTVADLGEHGLIERIRGRTPPPPAWVTVGIGDDAAVVEPPRGTVIVLTTDALVEQVHFDLAFTSAADVGHKALAVNLSDLAAMGAAPRAALLSLALPPQMAVAAVDALVDAFLHVAARHQVAFVGGNVTRSPGPLIVDVTAYGSVKRNKILRRAGARPGDQVFVSGTLAAAAAGLGWLRAARGHPAAGREAEASARCTPRYLRPEPRVRLGLLLGRTRAASACVDLSDGLADGARQVAAASGVGMRIDGDALPIDPGARTWFEREATDPILGTLSSGEDYELLFTVPPRRRGRLGHVRSLTRGLGLTAIGVVTKERELRVRLRDREAPLPSGFVHF